MNDFTYKNPALDQRASVTATVEDWEAGKLTAAAGSMLVADNDLIVEEAAASGGMTVTNYALMNEAKATATIEVTDWELLIEAAATGTIEITDWEAIAGKSFTINGITYTEGEHFTASADEETTAAALEAVIDVPAAITSSALAGVITITAAVAGEDGNDIDISTDAEAGVTLSGATLTGGRENAVITIGEEQLVQGTDFTAETGEDETAENIKVAAHALAAVNATRDTATVTIEAATAGEAGNALAFSFAGSGATASLGAFLAGGRENAAFNIGGVTLTAGTEFTAAVSDDATATSISEATEIPVTVTAADATDTVTFTAADTGEDGNEIVLTGTGEGFTLTPGGTLTGGADGHTITVGEDVKTFGVDITKGETEALTAEAIKDVIHALAATNATRSSETVNIAAATAGTTGNDIALATDCPGLTLSGALLTGGVDAHVLTVNGTALTEGTTFTYATSNEASAIALAAAADAVTGCTAIATGNVVTIWWSTPGTVGNSKTLATNDETNLPISGETFSGGVAATYTDAFDVYDADNVEATLIVTAASGTLPTLDVTPQRSYDGGDSWIDDATAFTQKTEAGNQTLEITNVGVLRRFKLVTSGTDPLFALSLHAIPKT